jgi:hypothetical protein
MVQSVTFGFRVDDSELECRTVDAVDVVVAAVGVHGGHFAELEDQIGLVGRGDELVVVPFLERFVDVVVDLGGVDGKVRIGAEVGKEDAMRGCDLGGHRSIENRRGWVGGGRGSLRIGCEVERQDEAEEGSNAGRMFHRTALGIAGKRLGRSLFW